MNDKWEARSDRLHMREYSSGLRNLRAESSRPLQGYWVLHHVWNKLHGSDKALGHWPEGGADRRPLQVHVPPSFSSMATLPAGASLVPLLSCGLGEVRVSLVSLGIWPCGCLFCGGQGAGS